LPKSSRYAMVRKDSGSPGLPVVTNLLRNFAH
jgi:hypothetical protein